MSESSAPGTADDDPRKKPRVHRRVTLPPPEGSDPDPFDPPLDPRSESENDDRLTEDRPPHWG